MGPVNSKSCPAAVEGRDVPMAQAAGSTGSSIFRLREKSTERDAAASCAAPVKRNRWNIIFPLPHANKALATENSLEPERGSASCIESSRLMFCSLASVMRALPRHSTEDTRARRVPPAASSANSQAAEPAKQQ